VILSPDATEVVESFDADKAALELIKLLGFLDFNACRCM
jgi:hypothetical protein